MFNGMIQAVFASILYFVFVCICPAAEQAKKIALIVGNSDYDGNGTIEAEQHLPFARDLKDPCRDAGIVRDKLKNYDFDTSFFYCNLAMKEFDDVIDSFSKKVEALPKGSVVFVFFTGHGAQFFGRTYAIPTSIQIDLDKLEKSPDGEKVSYFNSNAADVQYVFSKLPQGDNVAVFVVLDSCRDNPFYDKGIYNYAVKIQIPSNAFIQYSTNPGERAPDGKGGKPSEYVLVLTSYLEQGGDLGSILSKVGARMYRKFKTGEIDSYADYYNGPALSSMKYATLEIKNPVVAATAVEKKMGTNHSQVFVNNNDKTSINRAVQIIWCGGIGGKERFAIAQSYKNRLDHERKNLGIGPVSLVELSEQKNFNDGYNVSRNLMRFDTDDERIQLFQLSSLAPELGFHIAKGVGITKTINGKAVRIKTKSISAFICGPQ